MEENRARILASVREQLIARGTSRFSVDEIARGAGVTRVTVYNQFGSKLGLLEALFRDVGRRTDFERVPRALAQEDPVAALTSLVEVMCSIWSTDRAFVRRLVGLASVEPAVARMIEERENHRARELGALAARLDRAGRLRRDLKRAEATTALTMLTSFVTFDELAPRDSPPAKATAHATKILRALVTALLEPG